MKIDLRQVPASKLGNRRGCPVQSIQWKRSLPFLVNPRGHLIHRVRYVHTTLRYCVWSHDTAIQWCGNLGRGEFTDNPPTDRLLCAFCEAKAVAAGEKTTDQLAGRHVCRGTMKAVRRCCTGTEN